MRRFSSSFLATLGLTLGSHALALAQTAPASGETTWDLRQCIDQGLKSNLQVLQRSLSVDEAAVNLRQSRNNLLPSLNGSASHGYSFGFFNDPLTYELRNTENRSSNFSLSASVPLYSGNRLQNTIKQGRIEQEASQFDVQKVKNDLILDVVQAYMQILLNQELLRTNQERYNLTKLQAERTEKLFKAGSVAESNVLELQAQLASDELNIITAQNQIELAEVNLIQLLNLKEATPDNFAIQIPQLPDPDQSVIAFNSQDVYETAEQRMPEIQSAMLRIKSAEKQVEITRGNYLPTLSIGGNLSTRYSSGSSLFVMGEPQEITSTVGYVNGNVNQPVLYTYTDRIRTAVPYGYFNQLQDNFGQYIGLNLSVPIFNGFRVRNNVQLSKIGLRNAELNSEIAKNQLKQTIAQAFTDARGAQKRFAAAQKQLTSFEQAYRNAEIRLNNGLINSVDYNVARNNFVKAQSDIIQAKYDYIFKFKILDFYQGKTITL